VGLGSGLSGLSHRPLPTRTSRLVNQSTGRSRDFWSACLHVFLIRFVNVWFLVIFVAVILSHVNRSLIFLSHLAFGAGRVTYIVHDSGNTVTVLVSPRPTSVALTRTPSAISTTSSMRTDILERSVSDLEEVSTEPSLFSTQISREVSFWLVSCDET
jgi:hypothetical protein